MSELPRVPVLVEEEVREEEAGLIQTSEREVMSEFQGTPGEWYVAYGGMDGDDGFGIGSKGIAGVSLYHSMVAEYWPCAVTNESRKILAADAHLIAASKDLLSACQAFVSHYPRGVNADLDAACNVAMDAIKKAMPR